jgi:hypothetical protein
MGCVNTENGDTRAAVGEDVIISAEVTFKLEDLLKRSHVEF